MSLEISREPIDIGVALNSAYTLLNVALLLFLILGISFFYSGLTQRKAAFQQLSFPLVVTIEILLLWLCFGYSLSFSQTGRSGYLGNFEHVGLKELSSMVIYPNQRFDDVSTGVVEQVYSVYSGLFACISAVIAMGCLCERGKLKPAMIFLVAWMFLVYCPVAYWIWNSNGWMHKKFEVLDFAGGHAVHIVSGTTALMYSWFLGYRNENSLTDYRSSNLGLVVCGTMFMAIGWLGFNCGSLYTVNKLSGIILCNTLTSMMVAGLSWMGLDYLYSRNGRISIVGLCSGCVAGLTAITPCTAYISFWSSFVVGLLSGVLCNLGTRLKYWLKIDDSLDVGIHLIGGLVGNLLAGVFGDKSVAALGGLSVHGGWINRHFIQLLYQFLSSLITTIYVAGVCFIILFVLVRIPGCHLRMDSESEMEGSDSAVFNSEYMSDYVEFVRQLNPDDYKEE
ncbi:hypothetical protein OGAPHI_005509 [Ogataea philodendri]|uniref:Ammonium transporter AmtB-like domain-containing protein n=1 Tax=Ogataea philodendri TaxID=1378263 RepID=A0A9P8NZR9_9ASCO|nr:uncharacterized protein OGAPHI_005509 [Ogataea philodendri]KAH3662261.1 hypothetical protein OGAPHI_005509 [Ogataea philodendri]